MRSRQGARRKGGENKDNRGNEQDDAEEEAGDDNILDDVVVDTTRITVEPVEKHFRGRDQNCSFMCTLRPILAGSRKRNGIRKETASEL